MVSWVWKKADLTYTPETFIVSKDAGEGKKMFSAWDTPEQFEAWFQQQAERCFYEVIREDQAQRMKFDVDMPTSADPRVMENICDLIQHFFKAPVHLFNSTGQDKQSYHILVDVYVTPPQANVKAKKLFMQIRDRMLEDEDTAPYVQYMDEMVYSKFQNFRLVNCAKKGSDRVKRSVENLSFLDSLVTNTRGCKHWHIDVKSPLPKTPDRATRSCNILQILHDQLGLDLALREVRDNLYILDNQEGYHCPICDRWHDQENPFVIIDTHIRFFCRRHQRSKSIVFMQQGTCPICKRRHHEGYRTHKHQGQITYTCMRTGVAKTLKSGP